MLRHHSRNNGVQMFIDVAYPSEAAVRTNADLRPGIKLEVRYSRREMVPESRPIYSFVDEALGRDASLRFPCLPAIAIAAKKLVGLARRILRARHGAPSEEAGNDDRNLVRHLYDLAVLEPVINGYDSATFVGLVERTVTEDEGRMAGIPEGLRGELLREGTRVLAEWPRVGIDYERFVESLLFDPEGDGISFDDALAAYGRLIERASR